MSDRDPVGPGAEEPDLVRLDEDFIRAATIQEPPARERALWVPDPRLPLEPLTPAPPPRWHRAVPAVLAAIALVGGLAGAVVLARPLPSPAPAAAPPVAPTSTAAAGAAPRATIDPADPFAGTPYAAYADGVAGIVLPEPAAVGGFSQTEVAAALQRSRAYLIAADLEPATLLGGSAAAAGALLDPGQARQALDTALRAPSAVLDPLAWLTRFDPTETALAAPVKVAGSMSYTAPGTGTLAVHLDYLLVYAAQRAGGGPVTLVVLHHVFDLVSDHVRPGFQFNATGHAATGAICGSTDGYLHPDWTAGAFACD